MSPQIIETIKDPNFIEIISNTSEVVFDAFLEDGIIKDIPLIGTLYKGINLVSSIQDRLFTRKLYFFLKQLENTDYQKRCQTINQIENDQSFKSKIGHKILFIIDKCEDDEKAELMGFLFKEFLEEKFTYEDFLKLSTLLNTLSITDISLIFTNRNLINYFLKDNPNFYLSSGLFNVRFETFMRNDNRVKKAGEIDAHYTLNKLGIKLIKSLENYYN